jgi:DNA-binding FadR family transcriptional regulator
MLKQVKKSRLSDIVEEQLRFYIRDKKLKPGDSLPGELELSKKLGVSRSVLREGLSHLRSLGLLSSKQCRGLVVAEPPILNSLARIIKTGVISREVSRDLFELRLVLELGIADMIFMFITPDYIRELEEIVAREKMAKPNSDQALKCEIDFHKTLYKISGNETIINLQEILEPFFQKAKNMLKKYSDSRQCKICHKDLLEYIKIGDCDGFVKAMRTHLAPQFELVRHLRDELKNNKFLKEADDK